MLTLVGMTYGALIENAFLVEVVFSWPGLSAYGAAAVLAKDFNAVVGVTLVVGLSFVLANVWSTSCTAMSIPASATTELPGVLAGARARQPARWVRRLLRNPCRRRGRRSSSS